MGERLAVGVTHRECGSAFLNGPRRREAARDHSTPIRLLIRSPKRIYCTVAASACNSRRALVTGVIFTFYGPKRLIAGRSPLRLATLSLPTHREVVAAAFRISALVPPN
jgi:hypothetical protein